jgi:thermitase
MDAKIEQSLFCVLIIILVAWAGTLDSLVIDRVSLTSQYGQFRNWGLDNTVGNSHVHAVDAWNIEQGSRDVIVAVIDTGIDPTHPDIKNNLWHDKLTGYYGWDFVYNKPNPYDEHSHGTHVAGIIGAQFNPIAGISGLARNVSIMPVKYYDEHHSGSENLKASTQALSWAIDHGANIINYSGGGPEFSGAEYAELKRARDHGILVVAAAGNERQNSDLPENYYYPCAYRLENIICVAAINIHNDMLPSSNWGMVRVDVAAPGENILSIVPGGKYSYMSGTSQATAFVSGEAALILSNHPLLSVEQLRNTIVSNVDPLPSLKNMVKSGGKINAYAALASLGRLPTWPAVAPSMTRMYSTATEQFPRRRPAARNLCTSGSN